MNDYYSNVLGRNITRAEQKKLKPLIAAINNNQRIGEITVFDIKRPGLKYYDTVLRDVTFTRSILDLWFFYDERKKQFSGKSQQCLYVYLVRDFIL